MESRVGNSDDASQSPGKMRLPDMIIAGAPRCGTSWLYELADRHPEIEMAKPRRPEPKFFLDETIYRRGVDYYSKTWFQDIDETKIAGEKSTNYLENSAVPARIKRHVPRVKLIFILRNPVIRAYSNYCWSRSNGLERERFDDALDLELAGTREVPEEYRYAQPFCYLGRGLYRRLLEPYFALFPRDQILCLQFEDIVGDPTGVAERLHEFLGVASRPVDAEGLGAVNATDIGSESTMSAEIRARLEDYYETPNRELTELLGNEFKVW